MNEISLKAKDPSFRLTNKTFNFSPLIGEHFYTANYFIKSSQIVKKHLPGKQVVMQFFQRRDGAMVCGLDEAIALLQTFALNPEKLEVSALHDGDIISSLEPVLKIKGAYEDFGFLESIIDGILARRSSVATNTHEVMKVLGGKDVFSMADRQDDYKTQAGDGYASYIAGIRKFSTDAQGSLVGIKGMGTIPHALIALVGGDLLLALSYFAKEYPDMSLTALVDYHNNCVEDSLAAARKFGKRLGAVRIDTSIALMDKYFDDKDVSFEKVRGVSPELIFAIRKALNDEGYHHVRIVVSSSFDPEKIKRFNDLNVPVDMFGVGSYLVNNKTVGFTGDIVAVDGKSQAKAGRSEVFSNRLQKVVLFPRK